MSSNPAWPRDSTRQSGGPDTETWPHWQNAAARSLFLGTNATYSEARFYDACGRRAEDEPELYAAFDAAWRAGEREMAYEIAASVKNLPTS